MESLYELTINLLESDYGRGWPELDRLPDEEIVDVVAGAYTNAVENVGSFIDGLDDNECAANLMALGEYFDGRSKRAISEPARLKIHMLQDRLSSRMVNYKVVTRAAFNLYYRRMKQGEMSPVLGLVIGLGDPVLANDLLKILKNKNKGAYLPDLWQAEGVFWDRHAANNAPIIKTMKQYASLGHKETERGGSNLIAGIINRHRDRVRFEQTVLKPLEAVSSLPDQSLQIANRLLNQHPLERN